MEILVFYDLITKYVVEIENNRADVLSQRPNYKDEKYYLEFIILRK